MNNKTPALWFSIRPHFAEAILEGWKRYELRRVAPRVPPGSIAVVYATAPVKAIIGAFELLEIVSRPVETLWQIVGRQSALDRSAYDCYFAGKDRAVAITIGETWRAARNRSLDELRSRWPAFHPPQSYRYLSVGNSRKDVRLSLVDGPTLRLSPGRATRMREKGAHAPPA